MNSATKSVRDILLTRYQLFAAFPSDAEPRHGLDSTPCTEKQLEAFDIILMQECGIVLSPRLREHMQSYSAADLSSFKDWIIKTYQDAGILSD